MGFFGNEYDKFGYDSIDESTVVMPSYNNCYSNIHDMYEVACQLEIDGNDLIHEMEMNILMNEHNYFVEHGRAVQYYDGYGYLTEEGNSVWRFIQRAWETLMKYLDQCVSWVIDKCKEYIIYFRQLWAQKISVKDGIKGFKNTIEKAMKEREPSKDNDTKESIASAIARFYYTDRESKILDAKPIIDIKTGKMTSVSEFKNLIDKCAKLAKDNDGISDLKDAILKELELDEILGSDKADNSDKNFLINGNPSKTEPTANDINLNNMDWLPIQAVGEQLYKLLQKDFSDSLKQIFEYIRDKKKDIRQDRIDNRADDGDNEQFKVLKRTIKAYNMCASYIMKSFSLKIKICVTGVNRAVSALNGVKTAYTSNKAAKTVPETSSQLKTSSFSYKGGYQAIF